RHAGRIGQRDAADREPESLQAQAGEERAIERAPDALATYVVPHVDRRLDTPLIRRPGSPGGRIGVARDDAATLEDEPRPARRHRPDALRDLRDGRHHRLE